MSRHRCQRGRTRRLPLARAAALALALALPGGLGSGCGFSGEPDPEPGICVAGQACSVAGVGACADGLTRCPEGAEGPVECAPVTTGSEEVCDGVDNDCDGRTDEGLPDVVAGSDVGLCQPEIESCRDGSYQVVQSAIGPQPEVCGDGLDQDCDGADCAPPPEPPRVELLSPAPGSELVQGAKIVVLVEASDDEEVEQVVLLVDGRFEEEDDDAPYTFGLEVPGDADELILEAVATDSDGLEASTGPLRYPVGPDPGTRVRGSVVDELGLPVAGATARIQGAGGLRDETDADGRFVIADVPTVRGDIVVEVELPKRDGVAARSEPTAPVPGGDTEVGEIRVRTAFLEENLGRNLRLDENEAERFDFEQGFRFPFYGELYERLYISSNGRLTFAFGDDSSSESLFAFDRQAGIAALFDGYDFDDDDDDRGVFLRQEPDRLVVTWYRVEDRSGNNTFQAVLRSDGRIQIAYASVRSRDGLVGITPGDSPSTGEVDFSEDTPFDSARGRRIYEIYSFPPGSERFDLDQRFLIFQPIAAGDAYRVGVVPFED